MKMEMAELDLLGAACQYSRGVDMSLGPVI